MRLTRLLTATTVAAVVAAPGPSPLAAQEGEYARTSDGIRALELGGGTTIEVLLDASNLGSDEIEVAEITFPAGMSPTRGHGHTATEIFYVVEGTLGHVVNGQEFRVEPGMVGVVKPGDEVIHRVLGDEPVRALVLWVPGGEADRIAPRERWTDIGN